MDVKTMKKANKTEYVTGTGQKLWNVHSKKNCKGENCVIHNPSDHVMKGFKTHWRSDRGLMERICSHGIGHPDPDALAIYPPEKRKWEGIHGCDGCCSSRYFTAEVDWVDHDATPNGIGPVCKFCHRLIDWHPVDHALDCSGFGGFQTCQGMNGNDESF
jgi:hypothetical protein